MRFNQLTFLLVLGVLVSVDSFAMNAIYCKTVDAGPMKTYNVTSEEGQFACQAHLREGAVCFVGSRRAIVNILNNAESLNRDVGHVQDAHFKGTEEIAYTYFDSLTGLELKRSLDRCSQNFFKSPFVGPILHPQSN